MASVIQPKNHRTGQSSSYWIAVCTVNSKRIWKTTKVPIEPLAGRDEEPDGSLPTRKELREKAETVARGIERALKAEQEGTATEANLRAIFSDILRRTEGKSLTNHSIKSLLDEWLSGRRSIVTPGTLVKYGQIKKDFLGSLGKRATARLDAISQSDFIRFRDSLLKGGRSPATVNLYLNVLSTPFTLAFEQGLIGLNPLSGIPSVKPDHIEKGVFTPGEIAALLRSAQGTDWKGVILTGYYTGARLQDISKLRWESVHLENRRIRFVAQKTGKPVELPMHPELEEFLLHELMSSDNPKDFLFPNLAARKTAGKGGLSTSFARIMKKAGVAPGEARARKGEAGRFRSLRSFHSLRHTFNSAMANAGVSQEVRQKLTGHASAKMNSH